MIGVPKNDPFVPQSTSKRTLFSFCLSFFFSRPNLRHPRACFCLFFFVWFSFFFFFLFFGFLLVPSSSFCFLPRGTPGGCVSVCFFSLGCFAPISLPCFALLCFEQTTKKPSPVHTHTHTREREQRACFALLCLSSVHMEHASQPATVFFFFAFIHFPPRLSLSPYHFLLATHSLACLPAKFLFSCSCSCSCSFLLFLSFFLFFCSPHIHRQHPSSWAAASNSKHTQSTRQTMRHTT